MILALDIGGTKLAAALVDGATVLERREAPTPDRDRTPPGVMGAVVNLLKPLAPRAKALGVAATGSVWNGEVTALNSDTLQGWNSYDLRFALERHVNLKTAVLNDADAAAWGEARFGAGQGAEDFIFVTVSTGVGSGLVLGGKLYVNARVGSVAELGYTKAPDGQYLELAASGGALDRWARDRGWAGGAREVVARAATDLEANAKLDESAGLIAAKLEDLTWVLGLQRAVIGGGLGLSPGYIARIEKALTGPDDLPLIDIVPAALGTDAGLVGAAAWAAEARA